MQRRHIFAVLSISMTAALPALPTLAGDWTGWRGPARDGRAPSFDVPKQWPPQLERSWRVEVGVGHASPLVAAGRVYQHSRQGEDEVVRALDLAAGAEFWRASWPVSFRPAMGSGKHGRGPKATPALAGDRLFTMSISGVLSAWDIENGELLWRRDGTAFDSEAPKYGASASPLATEDLLVAHLGGNKGGALFSLDPASGEERWSWTGSGPSYASPVLAEIGGLRQILTQSHHSVLALDAGSGHLLWEIPFRSSMILHNSVTPVAYGGELVVVSGKKRDLWAVRPSRDGDAWTLEEVWRNESFPLDLSSPVVESGRLFGFSHVRKGQLFALEAATGKAVWSNEGRTAENAALVTAAGVVMVLKSDGELVVLDARADDLRRLASYRLADSETWAHPALDGRTIVVKDVDSLTRWSLPVP